MYRQLLTTNLGTSFLMIMTVFPISAQPLKESPQLFRNSSNELQELKIVRFVDNVRLVSDDESTPKTDNVEPESGQMINAIGQERYQELVEIAKEKIINLPSNVPLRFTIGVNHPVRLGESNPNTSESQWEVIGLVNQNQEVKNIMSSDVLEIFDRQPEIVSSASPTVQPETQTLSDSTPDQVDNDPQLPSGEISVINLIARNKQNSRLYLLPNVTSISIFRDALNATLNDDLKVNTINISEINPTTIPSEELQEI